MTSELTLGTSRMSTNRSSMRCSENLNSKRGVDESSPLFISMSDTYTVYEEYRKNSPDRPG